MDLKSVPVFIYKWNLPRNKQNKWLADFLDNIFNKRDNGNIAFGNKNKKGKNQKEPVKLLEQIYHVKIMGCLQRSTIISKTGGNH